MRFATLGVLGTALALIPAAGTLRAQINPATALNSAKSGAQTAGQSSSSQATGQSSSQAKTQQAPAKQGSNSSTSKPTQSGPTKPSSTKQSSTNPSSTKPAATHPNSTYLPSAKTKTASGLSAPARDSQKTVPVVARPSPAPAPQPSVTAPKLHSAEPMMKVTTVANRRDPFSSLIGRETKGTVGHDQVLPPGKAGLQVESLIIQGLVRGPNGMIAVVENPQQRVYFLHEGDSLFDGKVDRITIEGITFHESGKDAFGKPMERDVTKHLNASLGEQL